MGVGCLAIMLYDRGRCDTFLVIYNDKYLALLYVAYNHTSFTSKVVHLMSHHPSQGMVRSDHRGLRLVYQGAQHRLTKVGPFLAPIRIESWRD